MASVDTMVPVKHALLAGILDVALEYNKPLCIVGAPGLGKSEGVYQSYQRLLAAAWCDTGADILILHPVTSDPTDFKGLPVMTVNGAQFAIFGDLRLMVEATRPLVVFLDDLGQATATVQAAVMQLLLARRVNGVEISQHVRFVAATNDTTHRAGVTAFLEPLKGRQTMYLLVPDLLDWQLWGAGHGLNHKVTAFLNAHNGNPNYRGVCFSDPTPTGDMSVRPSPRGWFRVSEHMALPYHRDAFLPTYAGCVGKEWAGRFHAWLQVYDKLTPSAVVWNNPAKCDIPTETSQLWALAVALANDVTPQHVKAFCTFMLRLVDQRTEYVALALKLMTARDATLQDSADWVRYGATSALGKLLMGG